MRDVYVHAISAARGSRIEENDAETLAHPAAECERIVQKTGVRRRPIAAQNEFTSDLATRACDALLKRTNVPSNAVDALVVCTQTPDHLIPGVSSRVHGNLGITQNCIVLDINQGCSGFVLGTQVLTGLLQVSASNGILINADTYSKLIRPDDLSTRVLFGDAATAVYFSTQPGGFQVLYSRSFADGNGYDDFVAKGSALMPEASEAAGIYMDGYGILNFALRTVPAAVEHTLADNRIELQDVRFVVFHQANRFVIGQLARKLHLRDDQVPHNYAELGNTVSASIPLVLMDVVDQMRSGELALAVGFGVGLSWGTLLLRKV